MKFWKRTSKGKELMTLDEVSQALEKPLRKKISDLTDMIQTSYLEEKNRRLRHKVYYIRRINSYYQHMVKKYKEFEENLLACIDNEYNRDPDKIRKLQLSAKGFLYTLDMFWQVSEGDFKEIQDIADNPRLKDKFIFIVGTSVNIIRNSLNVHGIENFSDHALFYDRESTKVWMDSIIEFVTLLKDEVKGEPL